MVSVKIRAGIKVANTALRISIRPLLGNAWIHVNRKSLMRLVLFYVQPVPATVETAKPQKQPVHPAIVQLTTSSLKEKTNAISLVNPAFSNHV